MPHHPKYQPLLVPVGQQTSCLLLSYGFWSLIGMIQMVGFIGQNSTLNIILPGATAMETVDLQKKKKTRAFILKKQGPSQLKQILLHRPTKRSLNFLNWSKFPLHRPIKNCRSIFDWLLYWRISGWNTSRG